MRSKFNPHDIPEIRTYHTDPENVTVYHVLLLFQLSRLFFSTYYFILHSKTGIFSLNDVLVTLEVRTILFWNGTEVTGCPIPLAKFSPSSWTDFQTTLTHHN